MKTMKRNSQILVSAVAMSALALAGCSNSETDSSQSEDTATSVVATSAATDETATAESTDSAVSFTNAYVRAMDEGAMMTAIFGELTNNTDEPVTIESFTASIDAESFELHEVVDGQMRMKDGGYTIEPGETLVLQPGHEHMMAMGVSTPAKAGETVNITLNLGDGSTIDVPDVPVRSVGAGDENYGDLEHGSMDHEGHDHADHEH